MKEIGVFEKIDFTKQKVRFVAEDFDGAPESYDDFKIMLYTAFPTYKEKLDLFFSDLDQIVDLIGDIDKPMPFLCSGLEMLTSILPYIVRGPKLMKISKRYGSMTTSEFVAGYFEKDSKLFKLFSEFGIRICPPCS